MLSLIIFPLWKFSVNYTLAHCVCWNKRKRETLSVTHVHMTVYNFLQILTSLIASVTNPSLLMIIFAKIIIQIEENQLWRSTF